MTILVYLSKNYVGGWVTFTAHLSLLKDYPIYKITLDNTDTGLKNFGYCCQYQNITLNELLALKEEIIITALDKSGYQLLDKFPKNTRLVIHEPKELTTNKGFLLNYLDNFKCITIRKTVTNYLKAYQKNSQFLYHPYISLVNDILNKEAFSHKSGAVSISRIDYDKQIHIILKANELLLEPIEIYGFKNERYVTTKLKELDVMRETTPGSCYRGAFPKDYYALSNILSGAKYVVDLSTIKNDGGGSQYTFLEAIDFGCTLILHEDWLQNDKTRFISGYNCFTVQNENDLVELLNADPDTTTITENAKLLLEPHLEANGW